MPDIHHAPKLFSKRLCAMSTTYITQGCIPWKPYLQGVCFQGAINHAFLGQMKFILLIWLRVDNQERKAGVQVPL